MRACLPPTQRLAVEICAVLRAAAAAGSNVPSDLEERSDEILGIAHSTELPSRSLSLKNLLSDPDLSAAPRPPAAPVEMGAIPVRDFGGGQ